MYNFINILAEIKKDYDYTCGGGSLTFTGNLPLITSKIVLAIEIVVPILLVIFGMIDLGKAIIAQKEDDIKKGQQTFIKRLITAALVFLVVFVVKLVIGLVSSNDNNVTGCLKCFLNADDSCIDKATTGGTTGYNG